MMRVIAIVIATLFSTAAAAQSSRMVIGGPLDGSIMPGARGGMVIGGPLDGSIIPDASE